MSDETLGISSPEERRAATGTSNLVVFVQRRFNGSSPKNGKRLRLFLTKKKKSPFGAGNNKNHYCRQGRPGEHPAWRQINEIHLTFKPQNAKMPESTTKQRFSAAYQNPLIPCDISRQFPALCKCLPAIWFKQMSWVKRQQRLPLPDADWNFGCFLLFISSHWKAVTVICPGCRCLVFLCVTFSLHVLAPNSPFCKAGSFLSRGATVKVQSWGS